VSGFTGAVTATQFQGVPIDSTAPLNLQVLIYNSGTGTYEPAAASGAQGATGAQGAQGSPGATGSQGAQGAQATNLTYVNLADQSSAPSTPTTSSNLFAKTVNGRGLFQAQYESGSPFYLSRAPWDKSWSLITPNAASTPFITGVLPQAQTSGTGSTATQSANGLLQNFATAASSGSQAYVTTPKSFYRTQSVTTYLGGFAFYSRFYLPDASYSTNTYLFAGLSSSIVDSLNAGVGQGLSESIAAFQWATTGNWQFTTAGSTTTTAATSLAVTAQHIYETFIWCANNGSTVYWQINDVTAGTTSSGTATASLPNSGVALAGGIGLQTNNTTARNIQNGRVMLVSDVG
jgi:hypothetical protein